MDKKVSGAIDTLSQRQAHTKKRVKVGCFGVFDHYRAVEVSLAILSVTKSPAVLKSFNFLLLEDFRRVFPYSNLLYLASLGMNELV